MLSSSRETCLHPSWPSSRHISPATEFSGRLPPTCFPASPVASGSVSEISGGVACENGFSGRYAIAPLPLSGVGALDHWPGLQSFPRDKYMAICRHSLGGTLLGQSIRELNSLLSIFSAQASAWLPCHISH